MGFGGGRRGDGYERKRQIDDLSILPVILADQWPQEIVGVARGDARSANRTPKVRSAGSK